MENVKDKTLSYLFNKYYEKQNSEEMADLLFNEIIKLVSGRNNIKSKSNELSLEEKNNIIDATYKYLYNNINSLRGPLMNIYGEILNDSDDKIYIKPYLELISILLRKSENMNGKTM